MKMISSVSKVQRRSAIRFGWDSTDYLSTAHHSYVFLMFLEGQRCGG